MKWLPKLRLKLAALLLKEALCCLTFEISAAAQARFVRPPPRLMQYHRITLTSAILLASACAPLPRGAPSSSAVVERLYFGRNSGDTLVVTDSAWAAFLTGVITPRFPDGLTSWRAEGQWRRPDGVVEREPTFVVELVHPTRVHLDQALAEIIAEYKRRFHQESVLRVQVSAQATF